MWLMWFLAAALYFLPVFLAWRRRHPNTLGILLLTLFLGWSLFGWLAAMAWAAKQPGSTQKSW